MKLTEKISSIWKKHEGKIVMLGLATAASGLGVALESGRIGSYRPEGLSESMTSYTACESENSIRLFPPVYIGFGHGPIIDRGKDGTIESVGTITYPRMPISFNQLEIGTLEQREKTRKHYQNIYTDVMKEIRNSAE